MGDKNGNLTAPTWQLEYEGGPMKCDNPRRNAMKLLVLSILSLLVYALIFAYWTVAHAQSDPPGVPVSASEFTVDFLQDQRQAVADDPTLDEASKKEISDIFQAAIDELAKLETSKKAIAEFNARIESAPADTEAARTRRSSTPESSSATATNIKTPLAELERNLAEASQQLDAAVARSADLDAEPKRRTDRLTAIPTLIRDQKTKLATIGKTLAADEIAGRLPRAQRILLSIQKTSWTASITAMEKESLAYEVTDELLRLEREVAAAEVSEAKKRVDRLSGLVNERRKTEATEQARATQEAAAMADPAISSFAQQIADLAQQRSDLTEQMALASQQLQAEQTTIRDVQKSFQRAKDRVEAGGLSEASGNVLRRERKRLPNSAKHKRNIRTRRDLMGDVRFSLYDMEDRALMLASVGVQDHPDLAKHRILKRLGMTQADLPEVRSLLDQERAIVNQLIDDYNDYIEILIELDAVEQQLIDTTDEYSNYIGERVLWIRSTHPLGRRDLRPAFDAAALIGSPTAWMKAGQSLGYDIRLNWMTSATVAIIFLIILFFQRRLRRAISKISVSVSKGAFAQFLPTLSVLVGTVLISIPWPLLLAFVGERLRTAYSNTDFTSALAGTLTVVAWCWFSIEFLRQLIRQDGLADAHFDWPAKGMRVIREQLRWLRYLGLPLLFVVALTSYQASEALWSSSLGRMAFVCLMLLIAHVFSRVFHPTKGALSEWPGWRRSGWFYRLRHLWLAAAAAPVIMAVLAIAGYYETAQTIAVRLWATLCWVVVLIVLRSLLARWVLMNRRKIAIEQWRQRKHQGAEKEIQSDPSTPIVAAEPEEVDLAVVSSQTLKLIDTAILTFGFVLGWFIWVDVFPALGILRGVPAWPGAGTPTLADVLLAIATLIVTYIAALNIPGLLELCVLKYLPIDSGARYAVSALTRYILVIVGLSMAGSFVGITWSSIQWLVAAVGIGLGFGLQEIFANFVSGIVLLFEQPLRVGDVVTLGETTGVVSQIRIRATTITDWDHKEYVVPNKDLITGTLLNWTLTNQTSRIVVNVGVAYGSNTALARELLVKIATAHPHILEEPAPFASFEEFGDSSLNLVLRCFLDSIEERWRTRNDLHTSIDHEFKQAGIEIAFPQRDLHIRTVAQPIPAGMGAEGGHTGQPPIDEVGQGDA
jgi:small-conductance mechanosensitive channel